MTPGAPLVVRGDAVDVEAIMARIRERVALRASAGLPVAASAIDTALAERLSGLHDWNLPADTWAAMWPPNLTPWNLDQDFPLSSHRPGLVGTLLVLIKRLARALLCVLARPLLAQQVEVNRALALMTHSLARESSQHGLHLRALEQRLARMGAQLAELRGEAEPLLVFADPPPEPPPEPR